jgi:hypothetical protein
MGSLTVPRATRFETTTRFTGSPPESPLVQLPFMNMVPRHRFNELKPNSGEAAMELCQHTTWGGFCTELRDAFGTISV